MICGAAHPDDATVTCGLREDPTEHEFHYGYSKENGNIDWPNLDYQPKVKLPTAGAPSTKAMAASMTEMALSQKQIELPSTTPPAEEWSGLVVTEAHERFMRFLEGGGSDHCPVCERHAQIYKRGINKSMAHGLVLFSRQFEVGVPVDVPRWKAGVGLWQSNDAAQLRHWGLLSPVVDDVRRSNMADDSPDRSGVGWWSLTQEGLDFSMGRLAVPRFAILYNQKCVGLAGDPITIGEVNGFSFDDLPLPS